MKKSLENAVYGLWVVIIVAGFLAFPVVRYVKQAPYRQLLANSHEVDFSAVRGKLGGDSVFGNRRFEPTSYFDSQLRAFWRFGRLPGGCTFTATRDPLPADLGSILFIDESDQVAAEIVKDMCRWRSERIPRSLEDADTIAFVWEKKVVTGKYVVFRTRESGSRLSRDSYEVEAAITHLEVVFVAAKSGENRGMMVVASPPNEKEISSGAVARTFVMPPDLFEALGRLDSTEKPFFSGVLPTVAAGFPIGPRTWTFVGKGRVKGTVTSLHTTKNSRNAVFETETADPKHLSLEAFNSLDQILMLLTTLHHESFVEGPRAAAVAQSEAAKRAQSFADLNQRVAEGDAAEAEVASLVSAEELKAAALGHRHWQGRIAAILRISDRALLGQIAEQDPATAVREAAKEKLDRLLPTEIRTWAHRDGRRISGRILSIDRENKRVSLEVDGVRFDEFPIENFSVRDQREVAKLEP